MKKRSQRQAPLGGTSPKHKRGLYRLDRPRVWGTRDASGATREVGGRRGPVDRGPRARAPALRRFPTRRRPSYRPLSAAESRGTRHVGPHAVANPICGQGRSRASGGIGVSFDIGSDKAGEYRPCWEAERARMGALVFAVHATTPDMHPGAPLIRCTAPQESVSIRQRRRRRCRRRPVLRRLFLQFGRACARRAHELVVVVVVGCARFPSFRRMRGVIIP